mmetsp:Transcript_24164/g.48957  ORF Transcript_24164/g.48957 Transcript_24164/m.48957 type:complete len:346 (-) Transcript_24164:71-1108(-)|eukprot:CAMPEP_0183309520 /NCGR_PEP_ID=MMETSP0160_2-20130417/25393_1 /TAXON_ID=2839 ORGANISM="Odontella Sinensis, Strain Grunow 1884" /NCGR_SAMPLE_ID=MMETSP0160_2 /ASSEMBLY_ACC=CAM_ASM_000250 /LENGTH=345 /DNA_ID=CAMNT_0025473561 /DNA_START=72 /DNA_END=1106 /DNA_ORIENTATION=+
MQEPSKESLQVIASRDEGSVDSNFDPETPTAATGDGSPSSKLAVRATLESEQYDAATIRAEFKTYQSILPKPDKLLQEQHSFQLIRSRIEQSNIDLPRFLKYKFEGGIKPHHALCCLLLSEYEAEGARKKTGALSLVRSWLIRILSFGYLHRQLNSPAEFIRDQFYRVAHAIPADVVKPDELRKKIRNRGLPVPNYFLDPEDDKQFPPHIALLVILQDGEKESRKFGNILYRVAFSLFALVALLLRIVLEVIGGAGAIWGGAEVFTLRNADNAELWRWISVAVGVLCLLRFVTLNAPQKEDEGDILGPAGPWSLRTPVRLRAVCDHPFHYFVRALPPFSPSKKHD